MKKFLLGLAALTMTASAFGAVMSTDTIQASGANKNQTVTVTLPVQLEANVVDGSNKLFIEGTSGDKFGDVLLINFKDIPKGRRGEATGKVKVFRGDKLESDKYVPTLLGGTVDFNFQIDGKPTTTAAAVGTQYEVILKKHSVGTNDGSTVPPVIKAEQLKASIGLASFTYDGGEGIDKARSVTADIKALTEDVGKNHSEGKYYGTAGIVASLEIVASGSRP